MRPTGACSPRQCLRIRRRASTWLRIDLSDVAFMCSTGLTMLLRLRRRAEAEQGGIELVGCSPPGRARARSRGSRRVVPRPALRGLDARRRRRLRLLIGHNLPAAWRGLMPCGYRPRGHVPDV
ncbi:STAS domain-containing protein [Actinacidiphila glaucinigra]|uniref:STAS domain-containing protein n=1 Tax=Actinacidiphila glaucinigra TaxID=235986 RepID=UPI003717BA39